MKASELIKKLNELKATADADIKSFEEINGAIVFTFKNEEHTTNKPKDTEALLACITDAIADYAYENDDKDFSLEVVAYNEDGWSKADEL